MSYLQRNREKNDKAKRETIKGHAEVDDERMDREREQHESKGASDAST